MQPARVPIETPLLISLTTELEEIETQIQNLRSASEANAIKLTLKDLKRSVGPNPPPSLLKRIKGLFFKLEKAEEKPQGLENDFSDEEDPKNFEEGMVSDLVFLQESAGESSDNNSHHQPSRARIDLFASALRGASKQSNALASREPLGRPDLILVSEPIEDFDFEEAQRRQMRRRNLVLLLIGLFLLTLVVAAVVAL